MSKFLTEKIQKLTPYVPGEQPKERKYIKLNTNESPFPPSQKAIEKAKGELEKLMLYPDPDCNELTMLVAKEMGVEKKNVILSNGSDEVLNFAFMAYCDDKTPAIFADITYGFYKVFASLNGIPYTEIPLKKDFTLAVEAFEKADGTLFIANPNAPTGLNLPVAVIEQIVAKKPQRIVVIDEAYVDFGGESCVPLTKKYDNILVVQTFSKSRSMAGARLGFAVGNEDLISDLMRIKYSTNPYNVNRMTAAAGVGAIEDREYFVNNCKEIIKNREYTQSELKKLGFVCTDSYTNFVFAKSDKIGGEKLYTDLKEKGILVRHFNKEEIKEYNRITVGSKEEMQAFICAVKEILEK